MKKTMLIFALLMTHMWSQSQTISTIAGNGIVAYAGDGGLATAASLTPNAVTTDRSGNIYFVDGSHRIRKITASTGIITTVAGNGSTTYTGDGMAATASAMNPTGVTVDVSGNIYIADESNQRVRKVNTAGIISTIAGTGVAGYTGDGHAAVSAELHNPMSIAVDTHGNLYVGQIGATTYDMCVRKIDLATGIITTYAGNGGYTYGADNHLATWIGAGVVPYGLAVDTTGNLYIADKQNNAVRKVNIHDTITTVAGTGVNGFSGDGGAATSAELFSPTSVAVDTSNYLYINDGGNYRIRKVNLTTGIITTYCGTGTAGFSGDGGPATAAKISNLLGGITTDGYGLILSDYGNYRLRRICFGNTVPSIAISGTGTVCAGTPVTYTSTIGGGGTVPTYQWMVNGISVGTGNTYSYTPSNGDVVKCILRSNATCAFPDTAASASIMMVVTPTVTPTIHITSSATSVCAGTPVSFTSSITNGGTLPVYSWSVNGTSAGTSTSYSYTPANGDAIKCSLTSSAACATPSVVGSTTISMTVNPLPIIYTFGTSGIYTTSTTLTLSGSQIGVNYQMYDSLGTSGSLTAGTNSSLPFDITTTGSYFVVATSSFGCTDTSNTAHVIIAMPTETNQISSADEMVYPNPFSGQINLVSPAQVKIYDMTGGLVYSSDKEINAISLNVEPGMYLADINHHLYRLIKR